MRQLLIAKIFVAPRPVLVVVRDYGAKKAQPISLEIKYLCHAGRFLLIDQGLSQRKMSHVLGFLNRILNGMSFGGIILVLILIRRVSDNPAKIILTQHGADFIDWARPAHM